jgi:hypothetical protein
LRLSAYIVSENVPISIYDSWPRKRSEESLDRRSRHFFEPVYRPHMSHLLKRPLLFTVVSYLIAWGGFDRSVCTK